jgi:PilZ domain
MDERRLEVRMLCADMVDVRWKGRSGGEQRTTAILEDISSSGACLQMEAPIPLGVEIRWDQPTQEFHGSVRYCVYREIGYFVGVEFDPSFKWSEKAFQPQHLLDLRTLVAHSKKAQ